MTSDAMHDHRTLLFGNVHPVMEDALAPFLAILPASPLPVDLPPVRKTMFAAGHIGAERPSHSFACPFCRTDAHELNDCTGYADEHADWQRFLAERR